MENIFENAYFGKPYKTRGGEKAMYIRAVEDEYGRTFHDLETADYSISARCDGTERFTINESSEDIVGEWDKEITDEYFYMKNIFENAKFGDKFRTRDGRLAIYIGENRLDNSEVYVAYEGSTSTHRVMKNGHYWAIPTAESCDDVISTWE